MMTCITAVGFFACTRLAFPATELIEDGWPTAPVGVSPAMREQLCNLIPALRGLSPRQLEGLRNRLAGDRQLQGQAPGVQGSLRAWCSHLLRPGLHIVRMGQEGGDSRGNERGMQEGLHGTRPLGVDRVQTVDRLIQPDAELDLPAHPVEISDLPRADPGGQIR